MRIFLALVLLCGVAVAAEPVVVYVDDVAECPQAPEPEPVELPPGWFEALVQFIDWMTYNPPRHPLSHLTRTNGGSVCLPGGPETPACI